MCARAAAIFLVAFALIRLSGRRSFGMHGPLENIIVILLGAILSRGVVGATPMTKVILASITVVLLHRIIGWLTSVSPGFSRSTQGEKILLYENGRFLDPNMRKAMLCKEDVRSKVREQLHSESFNGIAKIYIERSGSLSIIKENSP